MTTHSATRKHSHILLAAFLIIFFSCKKEVVNDTSIEVFSAAKASSGGKPGSLKEVPLIVSFASVQDDGTVCKITGDGGDYVNGSQNVSAKIDVYGNFLFSTHGDRHLNYDFSVPTSGSPQMALTTNSSKACVFNMIGSNYSCTPHTALQNLQKGANPESVGIGGGFSATDGNDYHVSFHRSLEDTPDSPTSFAVVTRTKAKNAGDPVDEWIIVSSGSTCSSSTNIGSLKQATKTSTISIGYYVLPFKITLTAQ